MGVFKEEHLRPTKADQLRLWRERRFLQLDDGLLDALLAESLDENKGPLDSLIRQGAELLTQRLEPANKTRYQLGALTDFSLSQTAFLEQSNWGQRCNRFVREQI